MGVRGEEGRLRARGESGYLGLGAITGICEKGRLCHTGIEVCPGEVDAGSLGGWGVCRSRIE